MKSTIIITIVFVTMVHTKAQSPLKDNNSTGLDLNSINAENVDIVRQLLNQETIIRMTLVKNVHTLMKDMLSLQEKLAEAEVEISSLKKSTDSELTDLKNEVMLLKLENGLLRNITNVHEEELENLNIKLENVSNTLADIKIEVRFSSLTLLNLNTRTFEMEKEIEEVARSVGNVKVELTDIDQKKSAAISILKKKRSFYLIIENALNVNSSMDNFQSALRLSEMEQLKLSAAVSSLELLRANLTNHDHDQATKVAFTAGVTSSNKSWRSGVLVFDKVIFSIGSGYNPSTGVFTAPIEGNYVFYVSAMEFSNHYLGVFIDKNGKHQVKLIGDSSAQFQTGTNMVILSLNRGDAVWVNHNSKGGVGYYSESIPVTTFSGFLI
ncbi:uncharacterized protein LOC134274547 [Saccostrea cucullata]|uniref:uncharacterized protein LOC134274547 n=1 Tax=Saccostrea cuccullata TaxID=36930 RepID=UPI002ED450DF